MKLSHQKAAVLPVVFLQQHLSTRFTRQQLLVAVLHAACMICNLQFIMHFQIELFWGMTLRQSEMRSRRVIPTTMLYS